MDKRESNNLYEKCTDLMDAGHFKEAIDLAEKITESIDRAMIFIDAGTALGRSGKVKEGTKIIEELLATEKRITRYSLLYNAANGHHSIYKLRLIRRKKAIPPNDKNLRTAKKYYREALEDLQVMDHSFASQLLVNYGNCLSLLGRHFDAIKCYQIALAEESENGMAAGNMARELVYVAQIMGVYRHEYLALAYELLRKVFSEDMHLDYGPIAAERAFQAILNDLQDFMDAHQDSVSLPKPYDTTSQDGLMKNYVEFCLERGLFLNAWVGNEKLVPAITDEISFGPIVTAFDDNSLVPELARILNEIKESYAAARYLFFLSQRDENLRNEISEMTHYSDSMDSYAINSIYTGLCKTAYSRAFDVLDKVARIINVYFGIGQRESSFWALLAEKQSMGQEQTIRFIARPALWDINNYGLYALADLCIDYYESTHNDLKTIDARRNRITHDFLLVKLYLLEEEKESDYQISLDDLSIQTGEVLELAKKAILYAVSAVNMEEMKKETNDKIVRIELPVSPGQPFM